MTFAPADRAPVLLKPPLFGGFPLSLRRVHPLPERVLAI
jgi:hypothetical protein